MLEQILVICLFLILFIYLNKKIRNSFHILQLEHYQLESYNKWIKNHINIVFSLKEILIFIIIISISFINLKIAIVLGILLILVLYITFPKQKEKKPLVITNRIKRMYITNTIIFLLIAILTTIFDFKIGIIATIIYTCLAYIIVELINIINKPIEKSIQNKFYNSAKRKLKENENLKVIGITGSYGKTSTKYIVSTILEQKYNVLMTPESYNTTMGVVRTINEHMKPEHQIFVCEMGARHIGDIKEICDLVAPNYAILTSIGPQHLDTFKTLENVKKTKMELVDAIKEDGIAFVNEEDENIKTISITKKNIKYGLTKENCEYYADNIQITEKGSNFDIHTKDGIISVKTKLLGSNNIINIVAAVSIAKELGLSDEEIKLGIRMLKPVPHRLELIRRRKWEHYH
ncbi:MAG: UDP-N-acetylmuramoyl-tripeptide--D-alanyl-D-alanine ligase [Clostridia bacterium]|nr:UDP-N-acetylmuramoyl-tripeptide--D-alanyl-D-alanine ligase [Clostridia bacterium]